MQRMKDKTLKGGRLFKKSTRSKKKKSSKSSKKNIYASIFGTKVLEYEKKKAMRK